MRMEEASRPRAASTVAGARCGSARYRKARLALEPGPSAFDAFDGFVRSLPFLSRLDVSVLIVAGDEIIDNLLTHGEIGSSGVTALVRKRASGLTLAFFVDSHRQFYDFSSVIDQGDPPKPRFDEGERRWHGLGLTMCRNLASTVRYRPGFTMDRVILTFDTKD